MEYNEKVLNEYAESADLEYAWKLFAADKKKTFVVAQISPAVRVAIGERFGLARGEDAALKLAGILRALGADAVVDSAIAADALALMQAEKLQEGNGDTVFSSECGGWRKRAKACYPQIAEGLLPTSTELCARLLKKHYRTAEGKCVRVIAFEPSEGKKAVGGADVVLTTEELARIVECTEVDLRLAKKEGLDAPLGVTSGGAYLPSMSGGEAEHVARCLLSDKSETQMKKLVYSGLYAKKTRREANVFDGTRTWKLAVVSSLDEVDALLRDLQEGKAAYDYVEICGKDGGCVACGLDTSTEEGLHTAKLRALGLRRLEKIPAARSADGSAGAWLLVKEWKAMVRSGEAFEENEPFAEEETQNYEVVEEFSAPVEETKEETVEEPVEEVVEAAEEAVEETVEDPVEEVVEAVEETVEDPVEEVVEAAEETVEDPVEEVVETKEETVEETVEEPVEEVVETVEDPVEEVVEAVEEPVEEVVETVEETVEEPVEEVVEEITEEELANMTEEERRRRDPYYRRLSGRERRKLKRRNRSGK